MADLLETLTQQLGGTALKQMSSALGANQNTTGTAVAAALPMIVKALSKNASQPSGADALSNALRRDHDGSVLDDLGSLISGGGGAVGDGILGHVLGARRGNVEKGLSQSTGLDIGSMGKLLGMLAPVVMGALGRQQRQSNLDSGGLSDLLSRATGDVEMRAPQEMGILGKILDSDGDGDIEIDDIAKAGFGVLGKLLSR